MSFDMILGTGGGGGGSGTGPGATGGSGIVVTKELSKASGVWSMQSQYQAQKCGLNFDIGGVPVDDSPGF